MRPILIFLFLLGITYSAYLFYLNYNSTSSNSRVDSGLNITVPPLTLSDNPLASLESVLGVSISSGVNKAKDLLNSVTAQNDLPVVNHILTNLEHELSKLPEDQVKKFQYNYCQEIIQEYNTQHSLNPE